MVSSKKLSHEERRGAQELLRAALERVNLENADAVAARFLITLGDECQGLMLPSGDPVAAALGVIHALEPYKIRFAIGCGGMDTAIDPSAAIGADGPAFHNARRMIDRMKTKRGARLRFALGDAEEEEELNTVAALCDRLAAGWTSKQEELVYAMLRARLSGMRITQTELAELSGIGQSTVASQLAAAGCSEYCAGILYIRKRLAMKGGGEV
jgi:hypothetical protein